MLKDIDAAGSAFSNDPAGTLKAILDKTPIIGEEDKRLTLGDVVDYSNTIMPKILLLASIANPLLAAKIAAAMIGLNVARDKIDPKTDIEATAESLIKMEKKANNTLASIARAVGFYKWNLFYPAKMALTAKVAVLTALQITLDQSAGVNDDKEPVTNESLTEEQQDAAKEMTEYLFGDSNPSGLSKGVNKFIRSFTENPSLLFLIAANNLYAVAPAQATALIQEVAARGGGNLIQAAYEYLKADPEQRHKHGELPLESMPIPEELQAEIIDAVENPGAMEQAPDIGDQAGVAVYRV